VRWAECAERFVEAINSERFSSEIIKGVEHMLEIIIFGGIIIFLFETCVLMRLIGFRYVWMGSNYWLFLELQRIFQRFLHQTSNTNFWGEVLRNINNSNSSYTVVNLWTAILDMKKKQILPLILHLCIPNDYHNMYRLFLYNIFRAIYPVRVS